MKKTIKQVAEEAGVSTATVSRVLTGSGYVTHELQAKVHAAVEKLNYQTNGVARSLKKDKTYSIGVIIPDISNSFFMSIARGIEEVVYPYGYNLIFCSSNEDSHRESKLVKLLQEQRVDAMVIASTGQNETQIAKLSRSGFPVILLDRRIDCPEIKIDSILEDNVLGGYQITRRLLEQGHTRIGVINGFLGVSTGRDRYSGFLRAIHEAGIKEDLGLVYDGEFSVEGGINGIRYLMRLKNRPTAILSCNNNMTFGALQELTRMGLRIPSDVTVASYGKVEAALLLKEPKILYVKQSPYTMGVKTGKILVKRLQENELNIAPIEFVFQPELEQI